MKKLPIGSRIDYLVKEMGYNPSSFSRAIGIDNNVTLNRIVKGEREPSFDVLDKITNRFPCINTEWLFRETGKPFVDFFYKNDCQVNCQVDCQVGIKNVNSDAHPNAHPNAHLSQKKQTKKPSPGEKNQEDLHVQFSVSPLEDIPKVREHPEPYGKKTDPPPGCALCHANERVIAAMQAHIDTLERELHRQQVISDELREQQLHQQEAQKNDRHESGQKRKAG